MLVHILFAIVHRPPVIMGPVEVVLICIVLAPRSWNVVIVIIAITVSVFLTGRNHRVRQWDANARRNPCGLSRIQCLPAPADRPMLRWRELSAKLEQLWAAFDVVHLPRRRRVTGMGLRDRRDVAQRTGVGRWCPASNPKQRSILVVLVGVMSVVLLMVTLVTAAAKTRLAIAAEVSDQGIE